MSSFVGVYLGSKLYIKLLIQENLVNWSLLSVISTALHQFFVQIHNPYK